MNNQWTGVNLKEKISIPKSSSNVKCELGQAI